MSDYSSVFGAYQSKEPVKNSTVQVTTLQDYEPCSVHEVANWFLSQESMSHKKLQKLCYYVQAWGFALLNTRIINTFFEAWVHGPVSPELYNKYREFYWLTIPKCEYRPTFRREIEEVIQGVWERYGSFDGDELESLTHDELPWTEQRINLAPETPSHAVISETTMRAFYCSLIDSVQGEC